MVELAGQPFRAIGKPYSPSGQPVIATKQNIPQNQIELRALQ